MPWNRRINLAVCTVNQWSLDFEGNLKRILKTCHEAYKCGAKIRLGPELEIPGYGCADHFFELDTEKHSWEVLKQIVDESKKLKDLLIITGMPVRHNISLYNCLVAVINGKIVMIYPKSDMCDDFIYRESRYFVAWKLKHTVVDFKLDKEFGFEQEFVQLGDGYVESGDGVRIGFELCEELWTAKIKAVDHALQAVDITCNASGNTHFLGESLHMVNQLILGHTQKLGGVYLYANHRGCDGDCNYYNAMSSVAMNGEFYAQIDQFDIEDTCVVNSVLDLNDVVAYRKKRSILEQASREQEMPCIRFEENLLETPQQTGKPLSRPIKSEQPSKMFEIYHAPAAWLWSCLRRSGASGFFLPLSGGQDSCAVAVIVRLMCEKVCKAAKNNPDKEDPAYYFQGKRVSTDPNELCSQILYTCYMETENSPEFNKNAARNLAKEISSSHSSATIDTVIDAIVSIFNASFGFSLPDNRITNALKNVQSRIRMVVSYLFAQTSLIYYNRPGFLLVLGTSNVDKNLIGYPTKYGSSAGDLNPIGSICRTDLQDFLQYVYEEKNWSSLKPIIDSIKNSPQNDVNLTYKELVIIGDLRRPGSCGPYRMFLQLASKWHPKYSYRETADKVIDFTKIYAKNRHNATVTPPSYFGNLYDNSDLRNDHRPFLYPDYEFQFRKIREAVEVLKKQQ